MGSRPIKPMLYDISVVCAGALSLLDFHDQANQIEQEEAVEPPALVAPSTEEMASACPSASQYMESDSA